MYEFIGLEFTDPASSGTTCQVTTPASAAAGDLLIVGIYSAASCTWALSGWTNEGENGSAVYGRFTHMTLITSGSISSTYTFTGGASENHLAYMAAYRYVGSYVCSENVVQNVSSGADCTCTADTATNSVGYEPVLLHYVWMGTAGLGGGTFDHDHVITTPAINIRSSLNATLPSSQREQGSGSLRFLAIGDELWDSASDFPSRTGTWATHDSSHADIDGNFAIQVCVLIPDESQNLGGGSLVGLAGDAWGWTG